MKTAIEVFEEHLRDRPMSTKIIIESMKEYAEQVAKNSLIKASKNAYAEYGHEVCKESITNTKIELP